MKIFFMIFTSSLAEYISLDPRIGITHKISANTRSLLLHGCICSNYINNIFPIPKPVDDLDDLCYQWLRARECLAAKNGACENRSGAYLFTDENTCMLNQEDSCEFEACQVDFHYMNLASKYTENENWFSQIPYATCQNNNPGSDPDQVFPDACCGTAPNLSFYNFDSQICENGEIRTMNLSSSYSDTSRNLCLVSLYILKIKKERVCYF